MARACRPWPTSLSKLGVLCGKVASVCTLELSGDTR